MNTLGDQIRSQRKALGWSLDDLARHAGLSKTMVWQVERDRTMPSADSLLRLSRALGVSMDKLMCNGSMRREATTLVHVSMPLPLTLTNFAQDADLPFRHVSCLYWLARTIAEYRGGDVEGTDWVKLYGVVKEWLE